MSYKIDLAFKEMPKDKMLDFIFEFKEKMLKPDNVEKEIKDNSTHSPYINMAYHIEDQCKGCRRLVEEATSLWVRDLFEYKFCYIEEIGCVACVLSENQPKEVCDLFDVFIYFQNSCDQDYEYDVWGEIGFFKKQIDFIESMSDGQFIKWYKENVDEFFEEENTTSGLDYYRRSSVYELCYQPIEKVVWGNDNCIIVNLTYGADFSWINYKNMLKRVLIEKANKEEWIKYNLIECGILKEGETK